MKMFKTLVSASVAAAVCAGALSPVAHAEVAASASVASMYYWRGLDLGNGTPQVAGDIHFSESGFTAGVWGGSGDSKMGTEVDLYAGYAGGDSEGFFYDITAWTYFYPSGPMDEAGEQTNAEPGKLSELVLGVGYGPVKFTYYDNIAGSPLSAYMTLSGTFDAFSATLGMHKDYEKGKNPVHLDLSYAYNDSLKFTLGKVLETDEVADFKKDGPRFVVSYTLPLEK